jgi:alpha-1,6-mannosyltransferase
MLISQKKILDVLFREKPDIIEVDSPYRSAWIGIKAASELDVPIVGFYHSDYPRAFGRTVRRYAGGFVQRALSYSVYRYLINLYSRMSATLVATDRFYSILHNMGISPLARVPLGTDVKVFRPKGDASALKGELGIAEDTKLLLYAGRLAREKNVRSLLEMMRILSGQKDLKLHLLMVGDGEQRKLVSRFSRDMGSVTLYPYCRDSGRLAELFSAADLVVHPGTSETFGLVCLEAQACGARVLAVRGGGLEEALRGERRPVLAEGATGPLLAEAVKKCLALGERDAERRERRRRIVKEYSIDNTFDTLRRLYDYLCRQHAEGREIREEELNELHNPAVFGRRP